MAEAKTKTKPTKRQPKKRLPSSYVNKKTVPVTRKKKKRISKTAITKTKKTAKSVRSKSSKKVAVKPKTKTMNHKRGPKKVLVSRSMISFFYRDKKTKERRKVARKLNIKLGRRTKLTLTFKLTKTAPRKISRKKTRDFSFEKNLIFSLFMMIFGVYGISYSASVLTGSNTRNSMVSAQEAPILETIPPQKQFMPKSVPTRIRIKTVNLDVPLITVGKHTNGTLEVPDNLKVAGWYRFGPTPGEMGPAIIAGHVNDIHGPGVFGHLYLAKKGQIILINRKDGTIAKFKIDMVRQFPQNDLFPTQLVYGNIDYAGLRVITCGGDFSYLTRHYSDNTVVFASLIN